LLADVSRRAICPRRYLVNFFVPADGWTELQSWPAQAREINFFYYFGNGDRFDCHRHGNYRNDWGDFNDNDPRDFRIVGAGEYFCISVRYDGNLWQ